jgi:hypothetical protein
MPGATTPGFGEFRAAGDYRTAARAAAPAYAACRAVQQADQPPPGLCGSALVGTRAGRLHAKAASVHADRWTANWRNCGEGSSMTMAYRPSRGSRCGRRRRRRRAHRWAPVVFQNLCPNAPPSVLTLVGVQRGLVVAGVRRPIPRRIHGASGHYRHGAVRPALSRAGGRGRALTKVRPRPPRRCAKAIHCQQLPGAGHATQLDAAAVLETGARADDPVSHGAGHQDFAGAGVAIYPRRDMYGNSPDVGAEQFTIAGVDARADLDASVAASARKASAQRMACAGPSTGYPDSFPLRRCGRVRDENRHSCAARRAR